MDTETQTVESESDVLALVATIKAMPKGCKLLVPACTGEMEDELDWSYMFTLCMLKYNGLTDKAEVTKRDNGKIICIEKL